MAYTKYSLTPANNTATPPDGAPEGMLPSAVNDTMRDMMAQIRDCGDGIRDGTYTMTAPKITGGTITGAAFTGNTFTSPVISGGSINNTPIGGTTANSGAFTTLSASGVATISAGTVSAPALTTTGDTNTGIFFPAADTIAFTEGGVEAMRIDSSGQVGIGVTPNAWGASWKSLSVNTVGALASTTGVTRLFHNAFNNDSANVYRNTAAASMYSQDAGTHQWFYAASGTAGTNISFTEAMRIDSSGNVGIGTSSPTTVANRNLQVYAGSGQSAVVRVTGNAGTGFDFLQGGDGVAYLWNRDNAATLFGTNNTERMRITSGGNVGIGTSSPSYPLHVSGASDCVLFLTATNSNASGQYIANGNGAGSYPAYNLYQSGVNYWSVMMRADTNLYFQRQGGSGNTILTDGTFKTPSTISVGNATPSTSGAGITFPATQSASSDANCLDDYEEGTFTPTVLTGFTGVTYNQQFGKYTKIGNVVNFQIRIQFSGTGNGAGLNLAGLPFTSFNSTPNGGAFSTYFDAIAADAVWYVPGNSTNIEAYLNGGTNQPSSGGTVTNKFIIIAGQYFT